MSTLIPQAHNIMAVGNVGDTLGWFQAEWLEGWEGVDIALVLVVIVAALGTNPGSASPPQTP